VTGAGAGLAGLAAAALAGAVIAVSLQGGASAPAAPAPLPVATATVARTDLTSSVLTAGTLGYAPAAPIVNELSGIYTEVPTSGQRIAAGGTLYRVDNAPVVLMAGAIPAWRELAPGITDGPDVTELQSNLIALGDAGGLFSTPTGDFDALTAEAVRRWQLAEGVPATGVIPMGEVVFLASAVRVGAGSFAPGQAASPGQEPYQVTTDQRSVLVPLNPNLPAVHLGERVRINLPSGAGVAGRATMVGPAAPGAGSSAAATLTVTPARGAATGTGAGVPVQVSLTTQSVRNVLAVPVSALLALAGGGYGLEVVEPSGAHRLVGVRTGAFSGSRVQVSGGGIAAGTRVVVAQ
jgi:peptidoglycan hydrolase-like protein with peptidoglycan-binding domain